MLTFSIILTNLRAVIAARAARERGMEALLVSVWWRISRASRRLERLIARWRAGRLPRVRAVRAKRVAAEVVVAARVRARLPTGRAWLVVRVLETAPFGTQLEHALSEPEWAAFLAAAPQAGRILRPLCRMLGVQVVPAALREVKRVRVPVVRAAKVRAVREKPWRPGPIRPFWVARENSG